MIEAERIHPPLVGEVVHRSPVIRIGSGRQSGKEIAHQTYAVEVAVENSRSRFGVLDGRGNAELACEESARARGVDYEASVQCEWLASASSGQHHTVRSGIRARQARSVAVIDTHVDRHPNEMMIDVGAQPVRIRQPILRARGDEQALGVETLSSERSIRMMSIESEAALQAATNFGMVLQPPAVRRELVAIGETIARPDALEGEIGQRRRRFTDREAGVRAALEKHDVVADDGKHPCEERAGEAAPDDRDLARVGHGRSHVAQTTGAPARPLTFNSRIRRTRSARQSEQPDSPSTFQRSAVTTQSSNRAHASSAASSCRSVGGVNAPNDWRRSISPFPPRTGMIDTTDAPCSTACSTVVTVQATLS